MKDIIPVLVVVLLVLFVCDEVVRIATNFIEHKKIMQTQQVFQDTAQGRQTPFEATGFSLKRRTDGRLLLSFTRPHAEDSERFFFVDVILPSKTANDLTPILEERQWQEKKNDF